MSPAEYYNNEEIQMATRDLPAYPARGDRRWLDQRWLELLHQEGLSAFLSETPGLPHELDRAVAEFNRGQYWHCHETLESLWLPEHYPLRLFYHGLIKAAVGLLHLERHNQRGAMAKLRDAEHTLGPFLPHFMGINTDRLRQDVIQRLAYVESDQPMNWDAIDQLPAVKIHHAMPLC
jgi:predicted metal-dependent hydrolase